MEKNTRENYETKAIELFKSIIIKHKHNFYTGLGANNRITLKGLNFFQFGDLRVDIGSKYLVIEFESGGGVTNLAKYWYCLSENNIFLQQIKKPIVLFHIYKLKTTKDYFSHLSVWDFIWNIMKKDLSDKIIAKKYTYKKIDDLNEALDIFESYLKS